MPGVFAKLEASVESRVCGNCGNGYLIAKALKQLVCEPCMDLWHASAREFRDAHEAERQRRNLEKAREWRTRNAAEVLKQNGVLGEHAAATLADFPSAVQGDVKLFLASPERNRGLLVTGLWGSGKTRLLAAIAREVAIEDRSFRFTLARQLFRRIWATYRDGAEETEDQVIDDLTECGVLFVDDLAHEGRITEAVIGALHEIVSTRNGNYLPTVISTNLTLAEIGNLYGGAIASRLSGWVPIVLNGKDRRVPA